MNDAKGIRIEKVTLNIGTGKPGPELEKAIKLLQMIANQKPVETKTQKRIPGWELRPGLAIGCKVTLRKEKAKEVLKRLFTAVGNKLDPAKFSKDGNFAFGIKEYIDIPGTKYDASIGIIGLEAAVTLEKIGYRIKRRKQKQQKVPIKHRITKEEAMEFLKKDFGLKFEKE